MKLDLDWIGKEFNEHSGAKATLRGTLDRADLELLEAKLEADKGNDVTLLMEVADIILTLAAGCAAAGLPLNEAVRLKHQINMSRQWEPHPTIEGAVRRVRR